MRKFSGSHPVYPLLGAGFEVQPVRKFGTATMQTRSRWLVKQRQRREFHLCSLPELARNRILQFLAPCKSCVHLGITCKQLHQDFKGTIQLSCTSAMHSRLLKTRGRHQLYLCPTRTARLCDWLSADTITMKEFWLAQKFTPSSNEDTVIVVFLFPSRRSLNFVRTTLAEHMRSLAEAVQPMKLLARIDIEFPGFSHTLWRHKGMYETVI